MNTFRKHELLKYLNKLGTRASVDDAMPTLRNKLYATLDQKGFNGNKNSRKQISKFIKVEDEINTIMSIGPFNDIPQNEKKEFPPQIITARKVISSIDGKPLQNQSLMEWWPNQNRSRKFSGCRYDRQRRK